MRDFCSPKKVRMKSEDRIYFRDRLPVLLAVHDEANRLISLNSVRNSPLKWQVIWGGLLYQQQRIAVTIDILGGMAGEW